MSGPTRSGCRYIHVDKYHCTEQDESVAGNYERHKGEASENYWKWWDAHSRLRLGKLGDLLQTATAAILASSATVAQRHMAL